ncbi:FlgO family outer membrane protein [Trichlorobacter ammonificans]|nr:FlgO family outer membrane protein [Trichlorobacter ammonificans]
MIRLLRALLCGGLVLCLAASWGGAAEHRLKSKLAAVPFVASNIEAMAFTEYLTTVLLNELDNTGQFEIFERKRLESMMALEGVRSDSLTPEQMQRLGSRLGLDFLVAGTVTSQPQGMLINLRLLSLRSQKILFTEQTRMTEADTSRMLREIAWKVKDVVQGATVPRTVSPVSVPLQPPTSLEAVGSTNAVRLRWKPQNPTQVVGYLVQRALTPEGPFNTVSTVTEPAYTDENLRLNESFFYRVAAVGQGGGTSQPTTAVRGATTIAPAAPIFMNAEPLLGSAVLTWRQRPFGGNDAQTTPRGVQIYRRSSAEKEFTPVTRVGEEAMTFRDQGLKDGTTYLYAMTAFNLAGAESELSVQLSVTTPPTTGGITVTSGKVRRIPLSWQMHPFEQVNGYRLERATAQDGPYREIAVVNGRERTSYLDTDLADKTTYWYRVSALSKEAGTGGPSPELSATTRDLPPAPVKVTAGSGEPRRITISWESAAVADDEVTAYQLYRGEAGQETLSRIAELRAHQTSFRDDEKPLKDATAYSYVVSAVNAGGAVSTLSARATATTKAVPAMPRGMTAASGEPRRVTLRWQKNPEADITDYVVYRKHDDGEFRQLKHTQEPGLVDGDLRDGQTYSYRLQAVDKDGLESPLSEPVTAVTKSLPKPVDGLLLKDRTARTVTWQKSAQSDVRQYAVYKKGFFGGQKLATLEATEWKVQEPGKLELYVTAVDADGLESEPSAVLVIE